MNLTPVFNTPCGSIQGSFDAENNVNIFKGIRFATAERFCYPEQVTHWDGVYQATEFGPACYQEAAFVKPNPEDFYQKEFYEGESCSYSEDCLFLNIWAPRAAKNAAVLVYIHGGAFNHGYSYEKPFDGTEYCKKGIIVVTVSYRLHALGFLALPQLQEESGHTGNYALYDQMTALSWIRDNIRAFGGDPDNVTLSGQSAGAMCTQLLCVSPLTNGLFHRAIMLSGGGVSDPSRHTKTLEHQFALGKQLMERLGVNTLEELRRVDNRSLYMAYQEISNEQSEDISFCIPVVDHDFLPEPEYELAEKGLQKNIPYMIGTTADDIMLDLFTSMAEDWVNRQFEQKKQPSYLYRFARRLPGDDSGAWHSSDLWYVFGTLKKCWRPFTEWDYELSDTIMNYIAAFVKTGNPNGTSPVEWMPYGSQRTMINWGNKTVDILSTKE